MANGPAPYAVPSGIAVAFAVARTDALPMPRAFRK
jgi:hypothetical protein